MAFSRRSIGLLTTILVVTLSQATVAQDRPTGRAKNVILMIADGAGFNMFVAAGYFEHGELGKRPYDSFPVHYGCTTYMLNYVDARGRTIASPVGKTPSGAVKARPQGYLPSAVWTNFNAVRGMGNYTAYTDSAAAATALYTGEKTTRGRMAMDWNAQRELTTIAQIAHAAGKATGAVSSVQAAHATPGALWSHWPNRNDYVNIFHRSIFHGELNVLMGAGHPHFDDDGRRNDPTSANAYQYVGGFETWRKLAPGNGLGIQSIDSKDEFERLANPVDGADLPDRVVGIAPVRRSLQYNRAGRDMAPKGPKIESVPSLSTMSRAALNVLAQDPDGFLLVIEGGAVDWANHDRNISRAIEEQVAFNASVQAVVEWIEKNSGWDETLLIITSDHETGMIWGEGTYADVNGNGQFDLRGDRFLGLKPVKNNGRGNLPGVQYGSGGHTNALTPLWAKGIGSDRFDKLVDGSDATAGKIWRFSGKVVDNTDVFTVIRAVTESVK